MKPVLLAALAALGLTACAEGYYGPYGGGGMAYYDDFYGPYYDGYWGPDGFFYYRDHRDGGRRFHRDEGHHFQHAPMQGFHGVHAHGGFHGFHGGGVPHGDGGHGGGDRR
jgi:hypothetical protein